MPLEQLKQRLRDRMTANAVNAASGVQGFQDTLLEIVLEIIDGFRLEHLNEQEERQRVMDAVGVLTAKHATLIGEVQTLRGEVQALITGLKAEQRCGK